jgi:hypothetical protein
MRAQNNIKNNEKYFFETLLIDNTFLPLSLWQSFEIEHGKEDVSCEKIIKDKVNNKDGLYIYEKDSRIIYVGKAKPLFGRLKSHY